MAAHCGLRPKDHRQAPFPRAGQGREIAAAMGVRSDGSIDLQAGGGHAGNQEPVFRALDAFPAALGCSSGVGQVVLPQRVLGRDLVGRYRVLRIRDGLDGQQQLTEQPAGRFAGAHRHLERGQVEQRPEEPHAHRIPAQGLQAELPAFLPAAQEEEGVGGVGPQEVAVDGLLTGPPGLLDPFVRDGDRLLAATHQIQDGGPVRIDAEEVVEAAQGHGLVAGPAQHLDGRLGVVAPGLGHGQRGGRVK